MNETSNEKKYVFPSDKIGIEEEYLPGEGTYVENHEIKASKFGELSIDKKRYRANIFSKMKGPVIPKRYDEAIGTIERISKFSLSMKIHYINGQKVFPTYTAIMHVAHSSKDYVDEFTDDFSSGDIVRAKIVDAHSIPLQVETVGKHNGVVYSWCGSCGKPMDKDGKNSLKCPSCGNEQSKNLSIDYRKINLR